MALPAELSRLLTRELLYTAVTRASNKVTLVGDEAVIRHAITRSVERASGIGVRLWERVVAGVVAHGGETLDCAPSKGAVMSGR